MAYLEGLDSMGLREDHCLGIGGGGAWTITIETLQVLARGNISGNAYLDQATPAQF